MARQQLMVTSMTSGLLLLLLFTCVSLQRNSTINNHPSSVIRKAVAAHANAEPQGAGVKAAARKLLSNDDSIERWDNLCPGLVGKIEPHVGRQRQVLLQNFPLTDSRANAMENVGLLYLLEALEAKIYHNKKRSLKDVVTQEKIDEEQGVMVIVAASKENVPDLQGFLESKMVRGVVMFVPSIHGADKAIHSDQQFQNIIKTGGEKLKLFCHDKATQEALQQQGKSDVVLLPALTFCIPRVYRFLKPLYHYVFQQERDAPEICSQYIRGTSPTIRCDARSWSVAKWTTPKGVNAVEDVYLRTYIGYFHLLRGQIVVVSDIAALHAAMMFDIPAVAITSSPEMTEYLNTWQGHGYDEKLRKAPTVKDAAEQAQQMNQQLQKELVDFEPGIKIIKNFPK